MKVGEAIANYYVARLMDSQEKMMNQFTQGDDTAAENAETSPE